MLARRAQVHQAALISHLTLLDPTYLDQLASTQAGLGLESDPQTAQLQAQGLVYGMVLQQAKLWAFVDNFRIYGGLCLASISLVLLFRRVNAHGPKAMAH